MKGLILAAALAALCASGPAAAQKFKFSPPATAFTATGPGTVTKGTDRIACTEKVKMRTNAKGRLKITSVTFSGASNCPQAGGLPWVVRGAGFNDAFIHNFSITSSLGACSTRRFPIFLSGGTMIWSFSFPDCGDSFAASLPTSPTLSLVPK